MFNMDLVMTSVVILAVAAVVNAARMVIDALSGDVRR